MYLLTTTVFIPLSYRIVKFADPAAAQAAVETMNGIPSAPGQPGMKVRTKMFSKVRTLVRLLTIKTHILIKKKIFSLGGVRRKVVSSIMYYTVL